MTSNPAVQLFLDISKGIEPGRKGVLHWWVRNNAASEIIAMQVGAVSRDGDVDSKPFVLGHKTVSPDSCLFCPQSMRVDQVGDYPMEVHVSGRTADGRRFDLITANTPTFRFDQTNPEQSLTINIKGDLVKAVDLADLPRGSEVNIDAGLVRGVKIGQDKLPQSLGIHLPENFPALDQLRSLQLCPRAGDGLYPLDLDQFAQAWPQRLDAQLMFVDGHGLPRHGAAQLGDIYRLLVQSQRDGHLTLITQGSSGKYFANAPNPFGQAALTAHKNSTLPGDLLPLPIKKWPGMDVLTFGGPGIERALALITPYPLCQPLEPLSEFGSEQVVELLKHAITLPDAALAYAQISVEQKWFSQL